MGMPLSCLGYGKRIPSIGSANIKVGDIYAQAKVKIFPCLEGGPSAKSPYTQRGFHAASADLLDINLWNLKFPYATWGLPCALNNTLVLDADRHGKGDGVIHLFALFEQYKFDWRTIPVVNTPNNGFHVYFNRPATLGQTRATLRQAVDIRDKAYVIAPGSTMLDGRGYRLLEGDLEQFAEAIANRRLPDPPEWMMPMLVHPPVTRRSTSSAPVDDEMLKNQIKGLMRAVLQAEEGSRNNLLHWAACRLGELVLADLLTLERAEMLLDEAGRRLGLSDREIRSTAISGLRKGLGGDHHAR